MSLFREPPPYSRCPLRREQNHSTPDCSSPGLPKKNLHPLYQQMTHLTLGISRIQHKPEQLDSCSVVDDSFSVPKLTPVIHG